MTWLQVVLSGSGDLPAPGQGECSAEQDPDRCETGSGRARKHHSTVARDTPRVAALVRARLRRLALPDERINENDGRCGGHDRAGKRAPTSAHNAGSDESQHRGRERQSGPWRPDARVLVLEVPEEPQGRGNEGRKEGRNGAVHCAPGTVVHLRQASLRVSIRLWSGGIVVLRAAVRSVDGSALKEVRSACACAHTAVEQRLSCECDGKHGRDGLAPGFTSASFIPFSGFAVPEDP